MYPFSCFEQGKEKILILKNKNDFKFVIASIKKTWTDSHRFILLINCLINLKKILPCSNSLFLFCSYLHVHLSTIMYLLLDLVFKKLLAKFSLIFAWERETFKSQCNMLLWWMGFVQLRWENVWQGFAPILKIYCTGRIRTQYLTAPFSSL